MRRIRSHIAVSLSVLALAVPATLRAAGPAGAGLEPRAAAAESRPTTMAGAPEASRSGSLRAAAGKAVESTIVESTIQEPRPLGPGAGVTARRGAARARVQMGGGKGAIIMGLVYTAVGIGATVYMYKMIQDKNDDPAN